MVTEEGIQECSNCFFYRKGETSRMVECKRFPPTLTDQSTGKWPMPAENEWCGEWQGKRK